ncbi:MAG: hypothetical protein PVF34_13290, partial [Gammaproteobacteria bacterium]
DYFREANIAERVERYSSGRRTGLLIKGRLQKFERRVEASRAVAVVEMEIEYRKKTDQGIVKNIKIYNSEVPAQGNTIHDTVTAFGDALQQIYDTMLGDLKNLGE